jgi:hypothetical protein
LNSAVLSGGEAQTEYGSPSSEHSNTASGSLLEKPNTASVSTGNSAAGLRAISVSGAVWSSIVHSHSAGTGSTSRCCTRAWTRSECSPAREPVAARSWVSVYVLGDWQATNGAPSSEHSKAACGSSAENVNVAVVSVVAACGPLWMVTTGGVMSPISQL